MSERNRDLLREVIEREAIAWAVEEVTAERIDQINILHASFEGMTLAVKRLDPQPQFLAIDGNRFYTSLTLPFECVVKGYKGPATDLYPQKMFLDWKYTGPVLDIPEEFDNLLYMRDEIIDRLAEREEWDDDDERYFIELAKRFAANLKYDISGEMSDYRCRLIEMLTELGDGRLQEVIDELKMSGGRTGRETTCGRVLEFWKEQMQSAETRKHLMVHCRHYDVKQVEKELEQFPEELYFVWKANPERFVSKLYYRHIPREVIWRFVSGIAFVEMMNACAKKAEKPSGDTTIINIATNKKDNHFEKDNHCQVFNDSVEGRFGNLE
jgi:hypothetical protein